MEPGDVRFNGGFPATRHSAIERIRDADPETTARGVRRPRRGLLEARLQAPAPHLAPRRRGRARSHAGVLRRRVSEVLAGTLRAGQGQVPHVRAGLRRPVRHEHAAVVFAAEARRRRPDAAARLRRRRARGGVARPRRDSRSGRVLPSGVRARALRQDGAAICAPSTRRGPPDPLHPLRALRPRRRPKA